MNTIGLECLECRSLDAIALRPVALDIDRLAVNNQRDAAIAEIDARCRPLLAALIKATNDYCDVHR